ncbi:MAG: hypothetical protein KJ726_06505 [Verrucomicrobia bacterium]|nr:hypothetical protein [Verrucomicrobiota bacterium]MBU1909678.1 hypothetical protein [Verrucomicrobiota bacterium]
MAEWTEREHPEWLDVRAWNEWRTICALGLCAPPVQQVLMEFTAFHFQRLVRRYAYRTNAPGEARMLTAGESWHLFETHLTARQTRQGKRYKDWLFARIPADSPAPMRAVAGGAVLLMRDAAREYLAREFAPAGLVSLSSPLPTAGCENLSMEDLLPDTGNPADEVARREYEDLARGHAEEWFAAMGTRERVILLARHLSIPLANPLVEQLAGCRKSKACAALRSLVEGVAFDLRRGYPEDSQESLHFLTVLTLEALNQHVHRWASAEPRCADLLNLAANYEETAAHP